MSHTTSAKEGCVRICGNLLFKNLKHIMSILSVVLFFIYIYICKTMFPPLPTAKRRELDE